MPTPPIYFSTALTVAGDAAYDAEGDAYDGSAVKVEPSTGALAQGLLRPGRQLAAQHANWLDGQFAAILQQLIADSLVHDTRLNGDDTELANHEFRLTGAEGWIANRSPRIRVYEFLASGTFTVPARCVAAFAWGCGGGGAGGAGYSVPAIFSHDTYIAGGAGGGGALAQFMPIGTPASPLFPGTVLNVDVGAGGVTSAVYGGTGGDGGDSVIRRALQLFGVFPGAQGGRGSVSPARVPVNIIHYTMGGMAVRDTPIMLIGNAAQGIQFDTSPGAIFGTLAGSQSFYIPLQPAQGGFGASGNVGSAASAGSRNPTGFSGVGGAPGIKGGDGDPSSPPGDITLRGGGGGGGGGGGPFGNGGRGGRGQVGSSIIIHSNVDVAGAAALANTGAGGGGQGSEGAGIALGPAAGGAGGSGRVYIITVEESP